MTSSHAFLKPADISHAFLQACHAELTALKPGNVHIHADGHDMEVRHFTQAAIAAAPFIAKLELSLGERIKAAVAASMEAAGCNTNLGIILLCAPLAAAALRDEPGSLRKRLERVLADMDMDDACLIYSAIGLANPGGLGKADIADVSQAPTIPLLDAMALAAPRDRIAANYTHGFNDIFDNHLPKLNKIYAGVRASGPPSNDDAVATLYMSLLAHYPDSHIRRKFGMETAAHVQEIARTAKPFWTPAVNSASYDALLKLDTLLKANGWNPGTTADFVVATVFAAKIDSEIHH
ncbi:MAG: triphosphoribosyl-dephospho-CoA synthase [Hyphomicrobiaceae bacterium]|nr:triphosphoribosyl-dephospho-CoA synthase [Hyphomicrobiaceae bacterium]MCC0010183.1 triphosphoribosyl-dephospho-CoA synthase [Hyphomicrobiaceae bacterium]